jgi:hypothetical protein
MIRYEANTANRIVGSNPTPSAKLRADALYKLSILAGGRPCPHINPNNAFVNFPTKIFASRCLCCGSSWKQECAISEKRFFELTLREGGGPPGVYGQAPHPGERV